MVSLIAILFLASPLDPPASPQLALVGRLFGQEFPIRCVRVKQFSEPAHAVSGSERDEADTYSITFADSDDFMPTREVSFHLNLDRNRRLDGPILNQPSVRFGTPEYSELIHGHTRSVSCGRGAMAVFAHNSLDADKPRHESASDELAFRFSARSLGGGLYRGRIHAEAAKLKTSLQGEFNFRIGKFGED